MTSRENAQHELYEELAAGFALHALEPEDEQLFLLHAAACAPCERSLDLHRETAAQLAYGAGAVELPDDLFLRIRAQVVAESGEQVFARPEPAQAQVVDLTQARERRRSRTARLVAAAAAVVFIGGLGASNVALRQDNVQQTATYSSLQEAVQALEDGPGRSVPLLTDDQQVAAVAVLQDDQVSLVVEGLAANEADTTYVLWEQGRFGSLRALGTFDVREGGVEVVRDLPLRSREGDVAALAITREKGEDAPARPLTAPLASGTVDQA